MTWLAHSIALWLAAGAAPVPDADAALARPLSPGAVALLLQHVSDPRTATRLGEALRDPAPATRAAAARVVNVTGLGSLGPSLAEVLGEETDVDAGLEQLDALVTLDPAADAASVAAARRLGPGALKRLALSLAAVRGPAALAQLETLRALELDQWTWNRFLERAARGEGQRLAPVVAAALRERDARIWKALLLGVTDGWAQLAPADLAASLERDDDLRAATLWQLVLEPMASSTQAAPLAAVLESLFAQPPGSRSPQLEILARQAGRPAGGLVASLSSASLETRDHWSALAARKELRERLDATELEALRTLLWLDKGRDWPERRPDPPKQKAIPLHVATGYPRGYVEGTLAATGCRPAAGRDLGGVVRRGEDGRPRQVSAFKDLAGEPECLKAASVLVASHLNRSYYDPGTGPEEYLLMPLDAETLECDTRARPAAPAAPVAAGGRIKEPRKLRNVNPRYPDAAKSSGIQGRVVLEAVISPTGCIADLDLLQGVHPLLDIEAMRAVSRWTYTPTLLGGVAVPVIMTVNVNFKLSTKLH